MASLISTTQYRLESNSFFCLVEVSRKDVIRGYLLQKHVVLGCCFPYLDNTTESSKYLFLLFSQHTTKEVQIIVKMEPGNPNVNKPKRKAHKYDLLVVSLANEDEMHQWMQDNNLNEDWVHRRTSTSTCITGQYTKFYDCSNNKKCKHKVVHFVFSSSVTL